MRRRIVVLLLLATAAPMAAARGQSELSADGNRPNIVLLVLDDQDAFSPYWQAMPATARMLRDRGTTFRKAFCPTPICAPGRVILISGRLAHNTGVYTLSGPSGYGAFLNKVNKTFVNVINRLGYVNAHFGKPWGGAGMDPGWDYYLATTGGSLYEGVNYMVLEQTPGGRKAVYGSPQYLTDFLSDKVVAFLRGPGRGRRPFFLWISPTAPHLPLSPAPRHARIASQRWQYRLPRSPNFNEQDISDKSFWLQATGAARSAAVPYAIGEYHKRMGSLMAVDEMMDRIRRTLISQKKWNNTIVILTSDNGYNLGAHRLIHKQAPYEESIRVPLVIAGPGVSKGVVDKLVGLQDIGPTIVELAGGRPPSWMDGKSLVPFLEDGQDADVEWRTGLLAEYNAGGVTPGYNPGGSMKAGYAMDVAAYRALRTDRYKYIRWTATGEEELYDLTKDPYELNNLVKIAPASARRRLPPLRVQLNSLLRCAGGDCP